MFRHWCYRVMAMAQLLGLACVPTHAPRVTPTPHPTDPATPVRAIAAVVIDAATRIPLWGVEATFTTEQGDIAPCVVCVTNSDGYIVWNEIKIGQIGKITVKRGGYIGRDVTVSVPESGDFQIPLTHIDIPKPWETVTDTALYTWRGFISALLGPVPFGPRPGASNNVVFSAEYTNPGYTAADRAVMRSLAKAKGYVQWPLNPLVSHGYSGRYPNADWRGNVDGYLDRVEELWNAGFIPVFFLLPDIGGDSCADGRSIDRACVERVYTPLFTSPRFQALTRVVVLAWEPEYSASDWQWGIQYQARIFPKAKWAIHFPTGHAAPCRGEELMEGGGTILNEAACYLPIAAKLHFVLQQNTFTFTGDEIEPGRTAEQQFLYNLWDMGRRFTDGYAGWPTAGAAGHIRTVAFEWGSYSVTSHPEELERAERWGAMALLATPFRDPVTGATVDAVRYLSGVGDSFSLTIRLSFLF